MLWSTFVALQHPLMFKYQVDKEKYEKFHIPIYQKNYLPVERSILFKRYGNAIRWPIVRSPAYIETQQMIHDYRAKSSKSEKEFFFKWYFNYT